MKDPKKIYIENCTLYGRVQCTHCGSNTELAYIGLCTQDLKEQHETVLCKQCIKDIPSVHDDMTEEEAV